MMEKSKAEGAGEGKSVCLPKEHGDVGVGDRREKAQG